MWCYPRIIGVGTNKRKSNFWGQEICQEVSHWRHRLSMEKIEVNQKVKEWRELEPLGDKDFSKIEIQCFVWKTWRINIINKKLDNGNLRFQQLKHFTVIVYSSGNRKGIHCWSAFWVKHGWLHVLLGTWSENSAFCFSECLTTAILLKALKCVILRSEKTYKSVLKLSLVFWADIYFFEVAVLFSSKSREVLITLGKKIRKFSEF